MTITTCRTLRAIGLALLLPLAATVAARPAGPRHDGHDQAAKERYVSSDIRRDLIRRSQLWIPTDIPHMDLRAGRQDGRGFAPDELVTCTFTPHDREGHTPKFHCRLANGDVVKVKYGLNNGEIYAEVMASRLLWALGFGADGQYPVRVICQGCTDDPWEREQKASVVGQRVFEFAMIERPLQGRRIETRDGSGWSWSELDRVDEAAGGAPLAHRDALKLLAVFLQHTDSKAEQQRLVCLDRHCDIPMMYLHDVGMTFGAANVWNRNSVGAANLAQWTGTPLWRNPERCVGELAKSNTGTLEDPRISEPGRAFLADLLAHVTDQQLRDLFGVAHVERRSPRATVDDWVAAFKQKRDAIVTHWCPS